MKRGEIFPIKKARFSDERKLKILEKDISGFLSDNNRLKSNGAGPYPVNIK